LAAGAAITSKFTGVTWLWPGLYIGHAEIQVKSAVVFLREKGLKVCHIINLHAE
jgi:hypothetical protein